MSPARASADTRGRILTAAAALLAEGGREAVSTRAVSAAAGVQAPTIYRLFHDKRGLLEALAARGFTDWVNSNAKPAPVEDPVDSLRLGWDLHVAFGLANPALYALIYGEFRPGMSTPAAVAATGVLASHIHRIAEAGRLRVDEDRAARLVHAAGSGTTMALIATPEDRRDLAVSDLAREAVIAAITTDASAPVASGPVSTAVALRAVVGHITALTERERDLLEEWLDRIAAVGPAESGDRVVAVPQTVPAGGKRR